MKTVLIALIAIVAMSGCAIHDGRPHPANFALTDQYKLKSASHWGVVAQDVVSQFSLKSTGQAVYVAPAHSETTFSKVFASQLKSNLVAKGYALSNTKTGAIEISVTVDQVDHLTLKRYAPGTLTALAAGVLVLRDSAGSVRELVDTLAGFAVATDIYNSANEIDKRPQTEIVLTTVATKDGSVLMHNTNVYYLDWIDSSLFTVATRQFKLVGGEK